jgi:benzylsuccinate CoA-transferase BbsF subunit
VLGHLGAEVIKVESQARLDKIRESGPYPAGANVDQSGVFASMNYGKQSLTLNLRHPDATAVIYDLVQRSDVVTNNFKAAAMRRFNLSFETLSRLNPRIVYLTMSTMGADGPCVTYGAYGHHLAGMAGINKLIGSEGEIPVGMGALFPDFSCNPLHACAAILAGLRHVRATGRGVEIDISQLESTIHLVGPAIKHGSLTGCQPARTGGVHAWRVPHGVYRCQGDDGWLALSVGTDEAWHNLVNVIAAEVPGAWTEHGTFLARQRNREQIDGAIGGWTARRDKWTAARALLSRGVPAWPVNTLQDQIEVDPTLRAEFVAVSLQDGVDATVQRVPIAYPRAEAAPARPPRLGEHTFQILHELLGYGDERIAQLIARGALQ